MNKTDVLNKIKKCLRLAKSNNANEAAAAMRQAQKLMQKHGISQAEIDLSDINTHKTETHAANNKPQYQHMLVRTICMAFGVEAVFGYRSVEFIGLDVQAEVAAYAYEVLFRQLKRDRSEYLSSLNNRFKKTSKTRKADLFASAWVFEVRSKIDELAHSPKTKQLIEQFMESNYSDLRASKVKALKITSKDRDAFDKGLHAGRNAQLRHGMSGESQKRLFK